MPHTRTRAHAIVRRVKSGRAPGGWHVVTDPKTGRVLGVEEQVQPENNAIKKIVLQKVVGHAFCRCPKQGTQRLGPRKMVPTFWSQILIQIWG